MGMAPEYVTAVDAIVQGTAYPRRQGDRQRVARSLTSFWPAIVWGAPLRRGRATSLKFSQATHAAEGSEGHQI